MLTHLSIDSFRNLETPRWSPGQGSHLLLGDNGAGKTSFLEAIYVVATTRSFRTGNLRECIQHGAPALRLGADVEGNQRVRLEIEVDPRNRQRRVNQKKSTLAEHLAVLPVISWTAADTEMLSGAPELRRRFLDRGVVGAHPPALGALSRFRQVLGQKRSLLLQGGDASPWNHLLAAATAEVAKLRQGYARELSKAVTPLLSVTELPVGEVEFVYRPSPPNALEGSEAIEEVLRRALPDERRRRRPLVGAHRDDLEIRWNGRGIRGVASAGERKALALVMLAAHGRVLASRRRRPLYLLDDVDTELSPKALSAVWNLFVGESAEAELGGPGLLLATSNRPAVWSDLSIDHRWLVQGGQIEPSKIP